MNKLVTLLVTALLALVVVAATSASLVRIEQAAVPLVLVIGILVCVVRAVWFFTR